MSQLNIWPLFQPELGDSNSKPKDEETQAQTNKENSNKVHINSNVPTEYLTTFSARTESQTQNRGTMKHARREKDKHHPSIFHTSCGVQLNISPQLRPDIMYGRLNVEEWKYKIKHAQTTFIWGQLEWEQQMENGKVGNFWKMQGGIFMVSQCGKRGRWKQ